MKEAELIRRCLDKDKKAWGLFVEKYSKLVYWAIRRRLLISGFQYNEMDVEDIFQEIFVCIFETGKLAKIKYLDSLSGWLALFASRKTVDFMLKKARLNESFGLDEPVQSDSPAKSQIVNRDIADLVKGAIDDLSDKERIVISLNLLEGNSHKDISAMLRMPINTVSTIISRTKQKLAVSLEKMGIGDYF